MDSTPVPLTINGTATDSDVGLYNISYSNHFGDSPAVDYTTNWEATYNIHGTDAEQTGPKQNITVTATDNVGNINSVGFQFKGDNTAPQISLSDISEDVLAQYLYNASSSLIYYSNQGSGNRIFTITVHVQEILGVLDAGLKNASFPDIFIASDGGINSSESSGTTHDRYWDWQYPIPDSSIENGSYTITVYDEVNNSNTIDFDVYRDINAPTTTITNVLGWDSSYYLDWYNVSGEEILYFSNDQTMSENFEIRVIVDDNAGESGRASVSGSNDFGDIPSDETYGGGYYSLTYNIVQGEDDDGDNVLIVTAYDLVGNNATDSINLALDNTDPTLLVIEDVLESSLFLNYTTGSKILYYSNDQSMAEDFTIQISASDSGADLLNATGENEFGNTPGDTSYSTYYELTYQINQGESSSGGSVEITIFDRVGNSNTTSLTCTVDNTAPTNLLIVNIIENNDHVYYDSSREILFFSNDQIMTAPFTIRVTASFSGVGLLNATGETEFGDTPGDTSYSTYFELSYQIDQGETVNNDNITITIFDACSNANSVNLSTSLDNNGPTNVKITSINDYGSINIHLYNDSGSLTLFVSNHSATDDRFTIFVSNNEPSNESGRWKAIGSYYFGESPTATSYQYTLSYWINTTAITDNVENGTLTIWTFDQVNNTNSATITIHGDLTKPTLVSDSIAFNDYNSDYLHYNDTHFFFSNIMPTSQTITISGSTTDYSGGSGIARVDYGNAFGSSPSSTFSTSWNADYGINSTETEHYNNGTIKITFYDRVNNSREILIPFVSDTTNPSSLSILEITEDLLAEYLHYIFNGTMAILYYSNVRSDRGDLGLDSVLVGTIQIIQMDFGSSNIQKMDLQECIMIQ
jgi:hypothetical protein